MNGLKISISPAPRIPVMPEPRLYTETSLVGNPLSSPKVVDSPNHCTIPCKMAHNKVR